MSKQINAGNVYLKINYEQSHLCTEKLKIRKFKNLVQDYMVFNQVSWKANPGFFNYEFNKGLIT